MRGVLGYAVFVIGLALAVQTFFPGALTRSLGLSLFSPRPAVETVKRAAANVVDAREADRVASFSPGAEFAAASPANRGRMDILAFLSSQLAGLKSAVSPPPAPRDVTLEPWRSAVVPTSIVATPVDSPEAGLSENARRISLIREIQSQLKRVGCYDGNVDGSWGAASKRAMVAFTERVNASLPLNEPDDILLLLVKGQAAGTCGVACPLGQTMSRDHRCVPDAIIASSDRRSRGREAQQSIRVAEATTSVTTVAPSASPAAPRNWSLFGRMGMGGPQVAVTEPVTPVQSRLPAPAAPQSLPATSVAQASADVTVTHEGSSSEGASSGDAGQVPPPGPITDTAAAEREPASPKPRAAPPRYSRAAERQERRSSQRAEKSSPPRADRSVQHLFQHPLGQL